MRRTPPTAPKALKRRADAIRKAATIDPAYANETCWVLGCKRPPLAATTEGMGKYCRSHRHHLRRHGHTTIGSYTARHLTPYRRAAFEWIVKNASELFVKTALARIEGLLDSAGPVVEAHDIRTLSPAVKARAVFARIKRRKIDPKVLLGASLGVEAAFADEADPPHTSGPDKFREYPRVQMGKVLNTLGGGITKRWERSSAPDKPFRIEAFQPSHGLVLRRLGEALEEASELVTQHHLSGVFEMKRALEAMTTKTGKPKTSWKERPYPPEFVIQGRHATVIKVDDGPPNPLRKPKSVEVKETPAGEKLVIHRY
ncbi:hypothetical protein [Methylocella silvestris]|uniref:Uncharacterized protein n=1 Tax=Methylocella silvestris TaxID=199596 RepID=A0A2J7TCP6_METSI|nr:hypothetical protein [Methylocella silvestris]PNG24529.1 hypothetical protein CR492_18375 [Methylocella silvestris]